MIFSTSATSRVAVRQMSLIFLPMVSVILIVVVTYMALRESSVDVPKGLYPEAVRSYY